MGKFSAALIWLGAPLALETGGLLPWWGVVTWILSPFIAVALLGIGTGTIASIMDTCTGDRAIRGQNINSPRKPLTLKLGNAAASSMAPSAWTIHHPDSP
jgi:hypothetical protein